MATAIELTDANFEEHLKKGGTLLIDFWAAWCPPCRAFGPIFEASAAKHGEALGIDLREARNRLELDGEPVVGASGYGNRHEPRGGQVAAGCKGGHAAQ